MIIDRYIMINDVFIGDLGDHIDLSNRPKGSKVLICIDHLREDYTNKNIRFVPCIYFCTTDPHRIYIIRNTYLVVAEYEL